MAVQISDLQKLYHTEYDRWLTQTIRLLKNRQLESVDYEHLIEELEALGRSEKSAVKNLLLQIIIHLLLYEFWETERDRNINHWAGEIVTFRVQLEDKLTTNLRNLLAQELQQIYSNAALIVLNKTRLTTFPQNCPYSLEQLLDKNWFPF
ncbi:DUF29 domain-containing protein [Aphanothece hegewaldii CCALA 016]|uniref:DUF29 domain-containing protein n=1 Tax=Aphanothece hegewaldii CCALA 016 TaxID=2107694 RepID=A0A2T1LYZ3_9CHRO|nr:DUF29 domain-containing protein [Aphanothece hegewaldii]PSF37629.1 DUF29 domain-containing protein [Aphanothece hegewaldii CCALA 016]